MRTFRPIWITTWIMAVAAGLAACAPESDDMASETSAEPAVAAPTPGPAPATVSVTQPSSEPAPVAPAMPDVITAQRGGFIPEGVEYDRANRRFLTGSLAEGSIFEIGLDGSVTPVVTDPELVSSVGIEVDEARDRLLVANSDRAVFGGQSRGQAKLGVYSLTTGERLAMVDLGAELDAGDEAAFFANDVAVADDGTAFITDTQRNVVYRVGGDYEPSVHYAFSGVDGMTLNGIEWHPDGYLVIADSGNGRFYKLPTASGSDADMIAVPEALPGADGIVWRDDGALAVVQNSPSDGRVVLLISDDGWLTASIAGAAAHSGQATTGAAVGNEIFAVQPHFADPEPPSIRRAEF
ncbi:MAG: SMP-30/gluconolactonase/LRE family protein [Gammaproteobacteria bacterium]